jgi:dienelactone hydrolase
LRPAPDRIAVLGHSHGGGAALEAVNAANRDDFPPDAHARFRAAVAYYPHFSLTAPAALEADSLILVGTRDDWTPAASCENRVKEIAPASRPIGLVVYPGATHAFDLQPSMVYQGHVLDYDPVATRDAERRVLEFLRARLAP